MNISQLQKAVDKHPELLDTPALKRALQDLEVEEANERLQPVREAMKAAIDRCQAEGTLRGEDIHRLRYLVTEVAEDGKSYDVVIKAAAPVKVKRASNGTGTATSKISQQTWKDAGFIRFEVGAAQFSKPIKAIEAAGGTKLGTSENYWRVILNNGESGFANLPIQVVMTDPADATKELSFSLKDNTFRQRIGVPLIDAAPAPAAPEATQEATAESSTKVVDTTPEDGVAPAASAKQEKVPAKASKN